jgi:hypothetical protein
MAYIVNKTNSSASPNQYTVQDSVLNTQTDLTFIGKGYDGYGEIVAENFLHLLENFSNTTAPTKPVKGQLWYDETTGRLKVYGGTSFAPITSASYQSSTPSGQVAGDLWVDSDSGQLYFYNGTTNVLVGPQSTSTSGFIFDTIADATDTDRAITQFYNNNNRIAIMSEVSFTPKLAISGFASITKGINLSTAIAGLKFTGTATDSDALGGISAANFLRSNANDTTSGTLGILNDSGLIVGADNDFSVFVDTVGVHVASLIADADMTFRVNDGGTNVTAMYIDGSANRIGIGTTTPTTKLDVSGTINATAFTGPITGVVNSSTINVTTGGTIIFEGSTADDYETTLTVANPTADRTITLPNVTGTVVTTGDSGSITSGMFNTSTSLQILSSTGTVLKTIYGAGV